MSTCTLLPRAGLELVEKQKIFLLLPEIEYLK
jgi:hypothetical protein